MKIPQKIKRTKTGTTMKFGNNKNRQHRKNIIGDTECQETEMRKGKWHKRKCWTIILGSAFSVSYTHLDVYKRQAAKR